MIVRESVQRTGAATGQSTPAAGPLEIGVDRQCSQVSGFILSLGEVLDTLVPGGLGSAASRVMVRRQLRRRRPETKSEELIRSSTPQRASGGRVGSASSLSPGTLQMPPTIFLLRRSLAGRSVPGPSQDQDYTVHANV